MAAPKTPIDSIPTEILISIFASFSTQALLPLALVCQRFKSIVTRVLHHRLLQAAPLPSNELILECYHPSAKISTPALSCRYLGTGYIGGPVAEMADIDLVNLSKLYSRFRPVVTWEARRPRSRYPRQSAQAQVEEQADELATQEVHLDESELFSQLCTTTNVVKPGPKRGLFLSLVNIGEGVIRVWRDWLAGEAEFENGSGQPRSADDGILWADSLKTIGLRFEVQKSGSARMPLLVGSGEDPPVSYMLTYQELLVRTTKLLVGVEKSTVLEVAHSGKAIIIAPM